MKSLRYYMRLVESPGVRYFMHVTAWKNLASIKKRGLVPNHGGGNYDDTRWISLEGVYATDQAGVIENHVRAHDLWGKAVLLVIEVQPGAAVLPDEDMIDIWLEEITGDYFGALGITYEHIPEMVEYDDPRWKEVADIFHQKAGGGAKDQALLESLIDYWADHALYQGGDTDPQEWMSIKDRVVRHYPGMVHPTIGHQHSVRLLGTVGFQGEARIVCIIDARHAGGDVVYGAIPPQAEEMVMDVVSGV